MPVSLKIRNTDAFERAVLEGIGARPTIRIGISISGPASKYALVWEWGAAWLDKPGPKTTWGVNPEGEVVILTKTAPYGYIRTNISKFRQIVREEFDAVDWAGVRIRNIRPTLLKVLEEAAQRCAEVIAEAAPYDTGQLKEAIEVAQIGEETTDLFTIRPRLAL